MTPLYLLIALVVASAQIATAQSQFNPRDDQYRVLGLVRAKTELDRTESHANRAAQLAKKGIITEAERQDRAADYERARVDYAQQLLAIATADGHVTVNRAIKARSADGRSHVRLTLSAAPLREANQLKALGGDSTAAAFLPSGGVGDVIVSIKDAAGSNGITIARPYERLLARVGPAPKTISFDLLRETEDVVISLMYGGRIDERRVLLEQSADGGASAWRVEQFAQTADMGAEAQFGIVLERMADDSRPIRMSVAGLPQGIDYEYRDGDTKAKLTQIQFQPGQTQRRLQLVVSLPLTTSDAFVAERPIRFVAVAESSTGTRSVLRSEAVLEITPRGLALAELRIDNLLVEARLGDSIVAAMRVRNTGARILHGVRVVPELPAGWTMTLVPSALTPLAPGEERAVILKMTPPRSVRPGDYEVALRMVGTGLRETPAPARVLRVRMNDQDSGAWVMVGIGTLLISIAGYAVHAIRAAAR